MQHCICVLHTLTLHIYMEILALVFSKSEGVTENILDQSGKFTFLWLDIDVVARDSGEVKLSDF